MTQHNFNTVQYRKTKLKTTLSIQLRSRRLFKFAFENFIHNSAILSILYGYSTIVFDQIEAKEDKVHAYLDTYKKEAYARAKKVNQGFVNIFSKINI